VKLLSFQLSRLLQASHVSADGFAKAIDCGVPTAQPGAVRSPWKYAGVYWPVTVQKGDQPPEEQGFGGRAHVVRGDGILANLL